VAGIRWTDLFAYVSQARWDGWFEWGRKRDGLADMMQKMVRGMDRNEGDDRLVTRVSRKRGGGVKQGRPV